MKKKKNKKKKMEREKNKKMKWRRKRRKKEVDEHPWRITLHYLEGVIFAIETSF
jgi:hypothetical protein